MPFLDALLVVLGLGAAWFATCARVIKQYERGLIFRFGRVRDGIRGPGLVVLMPGMDRLRKVNMQIVTMPIPAQDGITRDNVTVKVDAVVYFNVVDPVRAVVNVQDYLFAVLQVAQTSLRSVIGKSELDDLLANRERLNQGLEIMIDSPALDWGIHIERVEIKDVSLPESMKRSMSRQAEAERERRARVITAEGELQASYKLAEAAGVMADTPAALQLRLLETVVEVAAEKNSTLVLPFPVELLRFLERSSGPPSGTPTRPDVAAGSSTRTPSAVDQDSASLGAIGPTSAHPATAELVAAVPATAEPVAGVPATAVPATAEPATAEPATAEPATAEPATAVPATAEPATAEPATAEPATAVPATVEPATAQPRSADRSG